MNELLMEMKEAAEKKVWFRGLELSRQDNIFAKAQAGSRRYFIVHEPSKRGKYEVYLDPLDFDWGCSCSEPDSPCSHAIAAAIALQGEKEGKAIPSIDQDSWTIRYQIEHEDKTLFLKRLLQRGDETFTVLGSVLEQKTDSHPSMKLEVVVTNFDLELDSYLKKEIYPRIGLIPRIPLFLGTLPFLKNISLTHHGEAVSVGDKRRGYRLLITKQNSGVFLQLEPESGLMAGDLFLSADRKIHPSVKLPFSDDEVQNLVKGRYLGLKETIEFYSLSYASLTSLMDVSNRGYAVEKMHISVALDSWEEKGRLCVRYHIGYGQPLCAVLDAYGLKNVSQSKEMIIPIRSKEIEEKALYEFEKKTGLTLLKIYEYEPPEAFEIAKRLIRSDITQIGNALEKFADVSQEVPVLVVRDGHFVLETSKGLINVRDLVDAKTNDGFYQLDDGHWIQIPRNWLEGDGAAVIEILSLTGSAASRSTLMALTASLEDTESVKTLESLGQRWNQSFSLKPSPIQLRPYQLSGAKWLAKLQNLALGGVLADDMGLGKTYQVLTSLENPALIIVPTSLLSYWQSEIKKARPELQSSIYHGKDRTIPNPFDIIITTYGIVRTDLECLQQFNFHTIILDEAQQIKNPESKTSRAVYGLRSKARIALSGTPIENSLSDLWSIMNFCMPGLLGNLEHFKSFYSKPEALPRLKKLLSPFLLRRLKKEVASDLPEKIDQVIRCTMESDQKDFYRSLLAKVQHQVKERKDSLSILTGLLKLRQAACDPFLVDPSHDISSAKLDYLFSALEELVSAQQAALVFSQWTSLLDRVEKGLRERGIVWSRIDGSTSDRDTPTQAFMSGSVPVMLISIKAGGTGLNLTKADHVFILDPWWNPAAEEQAIARAHRIGRTENVIVHRLVTEETVEDKIMALKADKMNLFAEMLSGREVEANLNMSDYESLLS